MAINSALLVVPAIDLGTLILTALSGYYVSKQSTTLYKEVKTLLLYVHIFFGGVLVLEFLRNFVPYLLALCWALPSLPPPAAALFMNVYTILGTSFILWDVLLLMTVGAAVYIKPEGQGLRELLVAIIRRKTTGAIYMLVAAFVIGSDIYLAFVSPFHNNSSGSKHCRNHGSIYGVLTDLSSLCANRSSAFPNLPYVTCSFWHE